MNSIGDIRNQLMTLAQKGNPGSSMHHYGVTESRVPGTKILAEVLPYIAQEPNETYSLSLAGDVKRGQGDAYPREKSYREFHLRCGPTSCEATISESENLRSKEPKSIQTIKQGDESMEEFKQKVAQQLEPHELKELKAHGLGDWNIA